DLAGQVVGFAIVKNEPGSLIKIHQKVRAELRIGGEEAFLPRANGVDQQPVAGDDFVAVHVMDGLDGLVGAVSKFEMLVATDAMNRAEKAVKREQDALVRGHAALEGIVPEGVGETLVDV